MALNKGNIGRRTLDITGSQHGDLFVTSYYGKNQHGHAMFNTKCSCGNAQIVSSNVLRMGKCKSCGCKQHVPKHGYAGTPEYAAFCDAKSRCRNPNRQGYEYYGGRGIEFKFDSFLDFINCIGDKPEGEYSLDRIDTNGHYEKDNVRWADWSTQMKNRRGYEKEWLIGNTNNTKAYSIIHPDGKVENIVNMAKFCRHHGLDKANLHSTIKNTNKYHKGYKAEVA